MLATDRIKKVHIMEVGPRDGFQSEKQFVPTETKIKVVNALSRTGLPAIQVTSFVHPKAIPQFVDAEDVVAGIDIVPGVSYRALVPNMRGLERARRRLHHLRQHDLRARLSVRRAGGTGPA